MYLSSRPLKTRSKSTRTHNVEDEQVFVARKLNSTLFNFNCKSDNPANSISRFTSRFGKIRQNQGNYNIKLLFEANERKKKVDYLENQVNSILHLAKNRSKDFSPEFVQNEIIISEINRENKTDIIKTPTESENTLNHQRIQLARASYQLKIPEPKETAMCGKEEDFESSPDKPGIFADFSNQVEYRKVKYRSPQPHIPPRRKTNNGIQLIPENESDIKSQIPLQITSFIKSVVSKN